LHRFPVSFVAPVAGLLLVGSMCGTGCSSSSSGTLTGPHDGGGEGDAGAGPVPTITGPITGGCTGKPFPSAPIDLASYGYDEKEYFFEGNATAYGWVHPATADGVWSVKTTTQAHYKSRLLARMPTDPSKFNGTVLVEWMNVSGGVDIDPDFGYAHAEILREGFGWVGVSAQAAGVVGGSPSILGTGGEPLVQIDPSRYGSLRHPGDDYSYDIYTQAARLLRHPGAIDPLESLKVAHFVANGESQSAFRLVTYVDAIQPVANVFDGFFIHSRFGGGALLNGAATAGALAIIDGPSPARIRGDLKVPVFQFETETDVLGPVGSEGYAAARQPDTDLLRTWEVAGTAHADQYLLAYEEPANAVLGCDAGAADSGAASAVTSCGAVNDGPEHWVEDAAIRAMQAWLKDGQLPPKGAPLEVTDAGNAFAVDGNGNALGGVRSPAVEVPIAILSGQPASGASLVCSLFGQTMPFSAARLMTLYPTHADYVSKVSQAAMQDQQAGFLVSDDVPLVEQEAMSAPVPQ
jgi:hypothetical protein